MDNLFKMAKFALKYNYFEFNGKTKLGTAIRFKFALTYGDIFMNKLKSGFLKSQELTSFLWIATLTIFSLSELMMKKNLLPFNMFLITTTLILSLPISLIKNTFNF